MEDRIDRERDVRAERDAGRRAGPVDLFDDEHVREDIETGAAVPLRDIRTHESERAHLCDELAGALGLLVDPGSAWADRRPGAVVRRLARALLLSGACK